MRNQLRLAAFRTLAPDTGAGEGGAAPESDASEPSVLQLADAAFAAAEAPGKTDALDETPDDTPTEEPVADADESQDDAVEVDEEPPTAPDELLERYPALAPLLGLEAGLSDVTTAPQTLRAFVETVANHYGFDAAEMLGYAAPASPLAPAPSLTPQRDDRGRFAPAPSAGGRGEGGGEAADDAPMSTEPLHWTEAGFSSQEEFDDAPDYQQAGFDSPGELRLARQLERLQAQVAPVVDLQRQAEASRQEADRMARYEQAVAKATPSAVAIVKAETGWTPTNEQVMAAAKRFPGLAAESLSQAVQAAHGKAITAHAVAQVRGAKPRPMEMPQGNPQPGRRPLGEDDRTDVGKLAQHAWEAVGA